MKIRNIQPSKRSQFVYTCSYILRIWREDASQAASWRITLEDPLTGERFGFASLEQLHKYLMKQIENE